jgi:DNA-binding Lrp family transcriptional regulator
MEMMNRELTEKEQELVRCLQADIPLTPDPFGEIAREVGMTADDVLVKVNEWIADGTIRRFGAMVRHQKLGYKANAMSAWDVPDERADEVGRILAAADEVSHCYQRPRADSWNYNLFAMIHGASREDCQHVADELAGRVGIDNYELLFSSREFKKVSMSYFME